VREIEEEISEEIAIVIKIAARCSAVHIPCFSSRDVHVSHPCAGLGGLHF